MATYKPKKKIDNNGTLDDIKFPIDSISGLQTNLDGKVKKSGDTMTGSLTIQQGNAINVSQYNDAGGVSLMNNGGGTATQFGSSSRPARMFSSVQPEWYKNGASQGVLAIKPDIKNGKLTIQQNGQTVGEFTANQSGNTTANITVPTKVSELTNDSGFTTNTGTITGITMNGASKGTSGVVDLGTVITAHQDISGKANLSGGNTLSGNQVITGYLDIRGTAAEKHLKTRGIGGSDGNGNSSDLYLQYSSNYKTYFGNTAQSSLNADGSISITSGTTTGNLTVGGNLTINGTTTTVDSTTLQVKDKLIEVAHGNTAPLTTPAGLVAPKYDGSNSGGLVFDSTGTAYVGDITIEDGNINVEKSGLQPLATRTGLVDGNLVQYNSSEQTLNDAGKKIGDFALKTDIPTNYVTTDTEQTINGVKTFAAPSNVSGKEQATAWFNTANNGRVGFGKEAANSGTGIFFEQSKGTRRLNFRASQTAGAMVWEQPESGAQLYVDLGAKNSDYHRISFPSSGGTLALTSQIPTVNNGTLTIQKNGTNVQTFTANQSSSVTANITVPTTASDVGAAPKKAGVYLVKGNTTGTEGTWTGTSSDFTDYYDGLVVAYDIGVAGAATTTLNINGKGAKTVYLRGTTKLTTHYAVGTIILLVYSADADCWYKADYDANTNTQVRVYRQDASSYNKDYPLIASRTVAADLGKVGTEGSYEGVYGLISDTAANIPTTNPYTGESKFKTVTATTFNGNLFGNATTADNATKLGGQAASYYENKITSVNSKTGAVSLGASDVSALPTAGGAMDTGSTITMNATTNANGANLKWGTVNSKNPYIGYASDQTDGTFVIGSLLGTNYASGLAIGGGSGNLLWKGKKVATTSDIPDVSGKLDKTTYEVNKTINFGSSGVLCVGKFKVYDTNVTCEITSTTSVTYSGKLVIATQNNVIKQMTVYGDAANTVAPNFFIKPSTTSDPYIEVYFKPAGWSKNVVHIYGSAIEAEPTNVCTNVSTVPSTATSKPTNALNSKANLSGGNTFNGQQIFQNTNSGAVAECVVNNTAWDSFTVRSVSDNTQKTAISNGYVWCQDSDAIYSRFNATGIYYGNDNNGYDCNLLFPEIPSGESLEKTIATTDQIHTYGEWSSGTSGTVKLPSAGTYQVRCGSSYPTMLWWDGKTAVVPPLIRTNASGSYYRFVVSIAGVITLKEGKATNTTETDRTYAIYYRRIGD